MSGSAKPSEPSRRDAAGKLAEQRLSVLEPAKELGNAAEACRRRGMDRTSFYEWKRRFQTRGFAGLKDLPPVHRSHPMTAPPETVARIRALALEHPAYGCNRLEAMPALEGGPRLGGHHPETAERSRARHEIRAPAGAGGGDRRQAHRDHGGTGGVHRKA